MEIDRRSFFGGIGATALAGVAQLPKDLAKEPAKAKTIEGSRWPAALSENDFYAVAATFEEMRAIDKRVQRGDLQGFVNAWTDVANGLELEAAQLAAAKRRASAHETWLRASNYHHRAHIALLRAGDGPGMLVPYKKMRAAWAAAWQLAPAPFELADIPYAGTTLPGMFAHADPAGRKRLPVVIVVGGSDHLNEKSYFRFEAKKFDTRGVSFFTLDFPGQGEPLNLRKMFLVPDFEKVAAAAIDYLAARPDVDASRIGVFGQAFSGFFAARAALDPRVRAVACRSASMDMLADCYDFGTAFRPQFEYMLGVSGEAAARQALRAYSLRDVAARIRVPIAIYHGGEDDVQDPQGAKRLYDAIPHERKVLKIVPGESRSVGREAETELVDWLVAQLG
jgi:dienelactone hydrolase